MGREGPITHKRTWRPLALSVFCMLMLASFCAPVFAAVIVSDGFEASNWNTNYTGANLPARVAAPAAGHGSWSLQHNNWIQRATRAITCPKATPWTLRFWFYDASGSKGNWAALYTAGPTQLLALGNENNNANWESRVFAGGTTGWVAGSVARSPYGVWKRLEIYYNGTTSAKFYVNNSLVVNRSGDITAPTIDWTQLVLGNGGTAGAETASYLDDVSAFTNPAYLTIGAATGGTVSGTVGGSTFSPLTGYYDSSESISLTATPGTGYHFGNWTTTAPGGSFSPDANTASATFTGATGDGAVTANFVADGYVLTIATNPGGAGTFTPASGGVYTGGASIPITLTTNPGYTFSRWTSDLAGTIPVSTDANFTYTMPNSDASLYAQFTPVNYNLTLSANMPGATTLTGAGAKAYNNSCTVTAIPNAGFTFLYWTNAAGASVSASRSYTFNMPASDLALKANFVKAAFYDGFETRNAGSLDMNHAGNPNASANGNMNGNPWFGADPTDCQITGAVNGVSPNAGARMLWAGAAGATGVYNAESAVNLAYRCNGGSAYPGDVYADWYFYDPQGAANGIKWEEFLALASYKSSPIMSATQDYDFAPGYLLNLHSYENQFLAIGGSYDTSAGYDATKYQIRVIGDATGYANGWSNTSIGRTIGWHHAFISVGTATAGVSEVKFYIDGALAATKSANNGGGYNGIGVYLRPLAYRAELPGFIDDVSFGALGTESIQKWAAIGAYGNADPATRLTTDYFAPTGSEATMSAILGQTFSGKTWVSADGSMVDFNRLLGSPTNCASYLFEYVINSGAPITDAELTMGSDDGLKVFLNGSAVWTNDTDRGITVDSDVQGITIPSGVNRLLVKVDQGGGGYQGQVRLAKVDGTALTGVTFVPSDVTAPTGTIQINGGASSTDNAHVTLTLSATDDITGVASMQFSEDDVTYTAPEPYATSKLWLLSAGNGMKTVYVKFIDAVGNVSGPYSASIDMEVNGSAVLLHNCDSLGGSLDGGSNYPPNTSVTVTATVNAGYTFVGWTRDGCGGYDVASHNPSYTFTMPYWDIDLYANFTANTSTLTIEACTGGTAIGTVVSDNSTFTTGSFTTNTALKATATPDATHKFLNWTTDGCGGAAIVSTSATYEFGMFPVTTKLSANFLALPHLILIANPTEGGTVTGGGYYNSGTAVNCIAVPNPGYDFKGWSSDLAGATIVSRAAKYAITTGATDRTLYAQFVAQSKWTFNDGFEGHAGTGTDETTYASLDSNGGGANASANGTGWNPWWGVGPPNGEVMYTHDGSGYHPGVVGVKTVTAWVSTNQFDYVNFAFRRNAGNSVSGNIYADWWFFDYCGQSNNTTANFQWMQDAFSIVNYNNYAPALDYPTAGVPASYFNDTYFYSKLSLGAANEVANGWDYTKYQARIFSSAGVPTGITGEYSNKGWINLPKTRSRGWHHCRIIVSPVKATGTNDVSFYIDDMDAPQLTADSFSPYTGYNMIETQALNWTGTGAYPYFAVWDDINAGSMPGTTNLAVTPNSLVAPGTSVTATWQGVGADHFLLKINSGSWVDPATSPYVIDTTNLPYGTNTVYVKAVDGSGNEGGTASATFTLDRSIKTWNVIGHYPSAGGYTPPTTRWIQDFFAPATTELAACAKTGASYASTVVPTKGSWALYTSTTPVVDLNVFYGTPTTYTQDGVSYLFNYVVNSSGGAIPNVYLSCGTDDGIKVFVNGASIGGNDIYRGCMMNSDLYGPFTLNSGPNRLMIKVTQGTGGYQAQAQLCNANRTELAAVNAGQITYVQSDDAAPTGSISINSGPSDGDAGTASDPNATLHFSGSDDLSGVATMSISYNGGTTWGASEAFVASKNCTLVAGLNTICVKFKDGAGNESTSHCATITLSSCSAPTGTTHVNKISDIWALANDATVYNLTGKTVTAMWSDGFWIEESNRSAGIKVLYDSGTACTVGDAIAVGKSVDVYGTFSTGDMRLMTAGAVVNNGAGTAIGPVIVTEKYSGGKQPNGNTPAVSGGRGIYGVGLLVKIAGKISLEGADYYIDDGSGLLDGSIKGMKVISLTTPPTGTKVVTGVIGIIAGKPVIYATSIQ